MGMELPWVVVKEGAEVVLWNRQTDEMYSFNDDLDSALYYAGIMNSSEDPSDNSALFPEGV
jgi:hypothetical protein